jgi:hypothetical protein
MVQVDEWNPVYSLRQIQLFPLLSSLTQRSKVDKIRKEQRDIQVVSQSEGGGKGKIED